MCVTPPLTTQDLIAPVEEADHLPGLVRTLWAKDLNPYGQYALSDVGDEVEPRKFREANVISSQARFSNGAASSLHLPVIDLDVPVRLVPSTTPGHSHLYIDLPMSFNDMIGILRAFEEAGVVETGYRLATEMRGMAQVRRPEVAKVPYEPKPVPVGKLF